MDLSVFIVQSLEVIVAEWEAFARAQLPAAARLPDEVLRNHVADILEAVAADIAAPQEPDEQTYKSKGQRPDHAPDLIAAARKHGAARVADGFTINQMVAEYRSLRASVLRLWHDSLETFTRETHEEQTRFNEAMDEALMESIAHYSMRLDEARDLFLGVLGHDLRNPLGSVVMSSALLMKLDTLDATSTKLATGIWRSGKRMGELISNLLDFTRTRLGIELPLSPSDSDLTAVCRQVLEEVEAYHPRRILKFEARGHLGGYWDGARIGQVVSNLLGNAIQHGDASTPVTLSLAGHDEEVQLCVHSMGPPIPPEVQRTIFEPSIRGKREEREIGSSLSSLGIGLYISSEIVGAHGGGISVDSSEEAGTSFTVRLPRRPNGTGPTRTGASVAP